MIERVKSPEQADIIEETRRCLEAAGALTSALVDNRTQLENLSQYFVNSAEIELVEALPAIVGRQLDLNEWIDEMLRAVIRRRSAPQLG